MQDLTPNTRTQEETRSLVRDRYGAIAREKGSCCGTDCCGPSSKDLGYSADDLASVPEGADLSLGCGNPHAIAELRSGETVLDLGSGAGLDCFLAAQQIGPEGKVIGVDMTPDMLARARDNARQVGVQNVEFRLGEIEQLPVADASVDVVISNCVVNLSPDKPRVFREVYRALRPGGRVAIADVVATTELPPEIQKDLAAYTGCIAGAAPVASIEAMLAAAGFTDIRITPKDASKDIIRSWSPGSKLEDVVMSATIQAIKPA
jgi:arsenite methyltransferase